MTAEESARRQGTRAKGKGKETGKRKRSEVDEDDGEEGFYDDEAKEMGAELRKWMEGKMAKMEEENTKVLKELDWVKRKMRLVMKGVEEVQGSLAESREEVRDWREDMAKRLKDLSDEVKMAFESDSDEEMGAEENGGTEGTEETKVEKAEENEEESEVDGSEEDGEGSESSDEDGDVQMAEE